MQPSSAASGLRARHSLHWRLPILVCALIVSVVITFLWVADVEVERVLIANGSERARIAADELASLVGPATRQRFSTIRRVADDPDIRRYLLDPTDAGRQAAERELQLLVAPGSQVLELWDANGRRLLAFAIPPTAEAKFPRSHFPSAGGVGLDRAGDGPVVYEVAEPVRPAADAPGSPAAIGFLVTRRQFASSASSDLVSKLIGAGAHIEFGGEGGGPWTDLVGLVPAPPESVLRGGMREYRRPGGTAQVGGLSEVAGTPWYVWVEFPRAMVVAPAQSFVRRMTFMALGCLLLAAITTRFATGRITRPLRTLTEASEAIAGGDYTRRVTENRRDEIGRLGVAFNSMVREVEHTRELLETENRRVQEASRMKSEFLASMSHELRTPLHTILGFASMLNNDSMAIAPPERKEFVGYIQSSGNHLLRLINDVLDLSKVEAGKLEFRPKAIDLDSVIADVLAIFKTKTIMKRVEVRVSVDPAVRHVVLDPVRLKQALYNYVSNALKFTPDGGAIFVRALPEGSSMLRIEVEDTGVGIADEDFGKLFVEFQQLDQGASKAHEGSGLGLALTRRIVEAQGGTVGVRSAIDAGSTFHLVLPRQTMTEATA